MTGIDDRIPEDSPDALAQVFDLERIDSNWYRGRNLLIGSLSVFGGQVMGQALMAATHTVEADRLCHSLHGYFLRPGDQRRPILYEVDRIRDGSSFTTRRVVAIQEGKAIFNMAASFQVEEEGLEHQRAMPDGVPAAETLQTEQAWAEAYARTKGIPMPSKRMARPVEIRPVVSENPYLQPQKVSQRMAWMRALAALPDDPALHRCVLAYASDFGLMGTAMAAHGVNWFDPDFFGASLDHAMWFHRDFRASDWLLYEMESDTSLAGRGHNRGRFYDREGRLVASTTQEGLMRVGKRGKKTGPEV